MELPEEPSPPGVELDREHGLTVQWDDGTEDHFELEELRINCPCAECRGARDQGRPAWPGPSAPQPLRALNAELVGAFGITIAWNDGHATGIFAWGLLRAWRQTD